MMDFNRRPSGMKANAGDLLMANAGGSAKLLYSRRVPSECHSRKSGERWQKAAVHSPVLGREQDYREGFFSNPVVPFAIGAAIGWGIFCAAKYCRDHEGGRATCPKGGL